MFKPARELRGFQQVALEPGERRQVTITVPLEDLRYFNTGENRWVLKTGEYTFQLCTDVQTVRLEQQVQIAGEQVKSPYTAATLALYGQAAFNKVMDADFEALCGRKILPLPAKFPVTLESRFTDLQQTFMGRILYGAVLSVAASEMKKAEKLPEGPERDNKIKGAMFMKKILESNSPRSMSMTAAKNMPYNFAKGFVELTNGHLLRGAKCFLTSIKVPSLPKDVK